MAERYLLQIEQGPNQGSRYPLSDSGGTIGRHAEATIVVGDQRASRRHARLDLNDGQVWLRDLGSANGTYLNGVQLRQPTALNPGDLITIGDTSLRFLAADDAATALNQPAPSPVALPEGETRLAHGSGTAPTRPASPGGVQVVAPGMTLNDRYALEEQVGQGGFARVYLATDLLLKRRIAVKVLSSDLAEAEGRAFLDRFALEAQSIAALDHPNILAIHDFGEAFGTVFLVMPYIEGGTLHDRLRARGQLPLTEVRDYLRQAAAALDFAHRRHLVHRDIKPQNMLLRADDNRLLLSDFGLAKVVSSTSAQSRTGVMGTIAYMAPEQFQGLVGPATDIYALGCVLFQMLTGQLPFTGPTEQVMYAHLAGPIPMLAERGGAHVPAAVQPILARALAKQPEGRYRTAGDLAAAFDAALGGATMPAPGPIPPDAEATVIGNTPPAAYHTPPFVPLGQQPTALNTPSAFAPPPPNQPPWLPPGPVFTPAAPPKRAGRRALLAAGALTGLALVGAGGGALAFAQRRDTPPPTPTTGFASGPVGSGGVAPGPSASASSAPPTPTFTPAPRLRTPQRQLGGGGAGNRDRAGADRPKPGGHCHRHRPDRRCPGGDRDGTGPGRRRSRASRHRHRAGPGRAKPGRHRHRPSPGGASSGGPSPGGHGHCPSSGPGPGPGASGHRDRPGPRRPGRHRDRPGATSPGGAEGPGGGECRHQVLRGDQ